MEPLSGAATDPTPYLLAAFGLGCVCLLGFALWVLWERKSLRRLLAAAHLQANSSSSR